MERIKTEIKRILTHKPNAIIAIDGYCASGKTTLAQSLAEQFDIQLIHMDDFFLPPEIRTDERLSQAGGNIHYERFVEEIISNLIISRKAEYRVFCCHTGTYMKTNTVFPDKPIMIEGAYSLHPEIPDIYDLKIFVEVSEKTQLKRIRERNGEKALKVFEAKWIPFEKQYFETYGIKDKCDFTIINE